MSNAEVFKHYKAIDLWIKHCSRELALKAFDEELKSVLVEELVERSALS